MTHKEAVLELLDRLPDERVREVRHYMEYLYATSQHTQWSEMALAHLVARDGGDEVEYTTDDLKP
jgi:hypothetical protein